MQTQGHRPVQGYNNNIGDTIILATLYWRLFSDVGDKILSIV